MDWPAGVLMVCSACSEPESPAELAEVIEVSAGNEPIAVELMGRTVRVRCEVACGPTERELDALAQSCRHNATGIPGAVAIDGESLRTFGCCHEAELAYTRGCGDDHERCTSGWLANCERGALSEHASSHVSLEVINDSREGTE